MVAMVEPRKGQMAGWTFNVHFPTGNDLLCAKNKFLVTSLINLLPSCAFMLYIKEECPDSSRWAHKSISNFVHDNAASYSPLPGTCEDD